MPDIFEAALLGLGLVVLTYGICDVNDHYWDFILVSGRKRTFYYIAAVKTSIFYF